MGNGIVYIYRSATRAYIQSFKTNLWNKNKDIKNIHSNNPIEVLFNLNQCALPINIMKPEYIYISMQ